MLAWIKNKFAGFDPGIFFDFENSIPFAEVDDEDCSRTMTIYIAPETCYLQTTCGQALGIPLETGDECIVGECLVGHPLN